MRRPVLIVAFLASFLAPAAIYGWSFYTQFWRVIIGPRSRPLRNIKFEITPARVARGAYLVRGALNCFRCHSDRDWSQPGAPPVVGKEGAGHVYADEGIPWLVAPNITPDLETGAGAWSDDMLSRAIREGISHDGRVLHPQMRYPALFHLSDEDLASVIVYLRTIPGVRNPLPPTRLPWAVRLRITGLPQPIDRALPVRPASQGASDRSYMVRVIDCSGCHTRRILGSEISGKSFAGGIRFTSPLGPVFTSNITSDPSGIGYYDDAMFIRVMRTGNVGARILNPTMPWYWYKDMSDEDLKSIFAALRAEPPVNHIIDNTEPPTWCPRCRQNHGGGDRN